MRLSKLTVENYRGYTALDLQLERDVTVLVGVNGAGKTSLLDAIAMLLTHLTCGIRNTEQRGAELQEDDIRIGAARASIALDASFGDGNVHWRLYEIRPGHSGVYGLDPPDLHEPIEAAIQSIESGNPKLPLAVYFPTNRSALDIPARIRTPHEFDALSAYDGALEGGASNFRGFFEWFREEEDVENEQLALAGKEGEPTSLAAPSHLSKVRSAIERLFPGASGLRVERRPQRMTLMHQGVRLDVSQLSDGEKCLLATAGDLARRMVLASPGDKDPLAQEAVVLIDEVELHLHPGMQRTILPRLREAFPNTQFIVSTHSPQVLSSVHARNVRLIEDFQVRPLSAGTWKRDTNLILESAFGDPGRPPDVAEKLNLLRDAVDENRYADAWRLVHELKSLVEGDDPELFFYEKLLPPEGGPEGAA